MQRKVVMWNYKEPPAMILVVLFLFFFCTNVTLAQSTDDANLIRSLVTNFSAAYDHKDVDGLTALWSSKSPDKEAFIEEVRKSFAVSGSPAVKRVAITDLIVEGASATVKLRIDLQTPEEKRLNRTLRLVKEDGTWTVWQYEPTERELATKLLSAKTESDQKKALSEAAPYLITAELVQALRKQAETLYQRRDLAQSLIAWQLTRLVAEKIGDENTVAAAINNIGVNYYSRGEYQQALEFFELQLTLP